MRKILLDFSVDRLKDMYQDCHVGRQPQDIFGDEDSPSGRCQNPVISWSDEQIAQSVICH